jgi:hypothetical protein
MKRILGLSLFFLLVLTTPAVEGGQVRYVGGTVVTLNEGVLGMDNSSQTVLNFKRRAAQTFLPDLLARRKQSTASGHF